MHAPYDDAELVARVRGGDDWAKEALYRRHLNSVWAVVLTMLGNPAEAEDVVQDAFIVALADIGKLREADRFGPWLMRIALHQVHRRYRRRRIRQTFGITWGVEDASLDAFCSSDCPPEVRAELGKISRILESLSPRNRIAWILRFVEGCSFEEIAERIGSSVSTARRRVAAANSRLRKRIVWDGGTP